jgi:hypothetical protein
VLLAADETVVALEELVVLPEHWHGSNEPW